MARKTISANGTTELGNSGTATVNTKHIRLLGSGWTGSMTIQGRHTIGLPVLGEAVAAADTYAAIPYRRLNIGGTVSDGVMTNAVITGDAIIEVPAEGMDIAILTSGYAAGSMLVLTRDVAG